MSLDNLDFIITSDPDDFETCKEHGRVWPCKLCQAEAAEYRAECQREERA